jgi:hypothetical protein
MAPLRGVQAAGLAADAPGFKPKSGGPGAPLCPWLAGTQIPSVPGKSPPWFQVIKAVNQLAVESIP